MNSLKFKIFNVHSLAFRAHRPESNVQNPAFRVQRSVSCPGSSVQNLASRIHSPESSVQGPASSVQSPESNTCVQSPGIPVYPYKKTCQNTEISGLWMQVLDARLCTPVTLNSSLCNSKPWMLDSGRWTLDARLWRLKL